MGSIPTFSVMLVYHFKEISYRILYIMFSFLLSALIVWHFREEWLQLFCTLPLIYIHLYEAFFSFLELSLTSAFVVTTPYILYHILSFLTPGLYKYEFSNFISFGFTFTFLFFSLLILYFVYLLPTLVTFFSGFQSGLLTQSITLKDYIQFITLIISLAFFTLILPFLTFVIRVQGYRKFIYMFLSLMSALVTPPDVFSLIVTTIPTIILFEIATFVSLINRDTGT